jgi:hypothetical protein
MGITAVRHSPDGNLHVPRFVHQQQQQAATVARIPLSNAFVLGVDPPRRTQGLGPSRFNLVARRVIEAELTKHR